MVFSSMTVTETEASNDTSTLPGTSLTNPVHSFGIEHVVQLIHQLYFNPELALKASTALTAFQTSPNAWDTSVFLLVACAPASPDPSSLLSVTKLDQPNQAPFPSIDDLLKDVVAFFAAQTLCTLCQSGCRGGVQSAYISSAQMCGDAQDDGLSLVRRILTEVLWLYRAASRTTAPTVRQLTQAVAASFLFSLADALVALPSPQQAGQDSTRLAVASGRVILSELVERYTQVDLLFPACLNILSTLPTDVSHNKKLALTTDQRERLSCVLLYHIGNIFDTVAKIHDAGLQSSAAGDAKGERVLYAAIVSRWLLYSSSNQSLAQQPFEHIASCLADVTWYQQQFASLAHSYSPFDAPANNYAASSQRDQQFEALRLLILQCLHSWLEALTRYRQRHSEEQKPLSTGTLPSVLLGDKGNTLTSGFDDSVGSTLHDAGLLLRSSVLPISLLNLIFGVHMTLSQAAAGRDSSVACNDDDDDDNDHSGARDATLTVTAELENCGNSTDGSILHTACDNLIEILELLYTMHSAPSLDSLSNPAEREDDPFLSLINWTNFEPLMCIFHGVCHIDQAIRAHCAAVSNSSRGIRGCGAQNGSSNRLFYAQSASSHIPAASIAAIPGDFLRVFISFVAKFAEIFLPALVYTIQYCAFNATDFQVPAAFPPCDGINVFMSPSQATEQQKVLSATQSLFNLMLDLLQHPSLEIRHLVLDFWFSLVGNQYTIQQAQLESSEEDFSQTIHTDLDPHATIPQKLYPPFIVATFDGLVDSIMALAEYPDNLVDIQDTFPFTAWIKFRDECSMSLTDATTVLTCGPIIEKAGKRLVSLLDRLKNDASFSLCRQIEVCLFVLTAVTPRAQAGVDPYIPMAIEALPSLPYPQTATVDAHILTVAAARLMLWTVGYIGTNRELFAKCFQLLKSFIPSLMNCSKGVPSSSDNKPYAMKTELRVFWDYAERVVIEAMNSIVTAAATTLAMDMMVPESDITFVLNGLADSVLITQLTMESRCSLILSAGALLQCLSMDKMQKYHYQLAKALESRVLAGLPSTTPSGTPIKVTTEVAEFFKLFFTALESVKPVDPIPAPPFSHNAVPLEPSSEYRHPVLNVVEEFWPLFERCLLDFHSSEMLIEAACHCVIRTFSQNAAHVIRYTIFQRFLECLAASFQRTPSIFHLAALRTMLGVFGNNREEPVLRHLNQCLLTCTTFVLNAMRASGVHHFVTQTPDIVGMTLDCTNTVLSSPRLTAEILQVPAFCDALTLSITLTPECRHPKVLMTMLLLMTRFVDWLDSKECADSPPLKSWWKGKPPAERNPALYRTCSDQARALCERLGLLQKIITSVMRAVTEIFHGNAQWIEIVATLLVDLLHTPGFTHATQQAIRSALESCPRHIVTASIMADFCDALRTPNTITHPSVCYALQKLADQCEIKWQQGQFSQVNGATATFSS